MAFIQFTTVDSVYTEVRKGFGNRCNRSVMYVETSVDGSEIFDQIKDEVNHDDMMACLTEDEVRKYFDIHDIDCLDNLVTSIGADAIFERLKDYISVELLTAVNL